MNRFVPALVTTALIPLIVTPARADGAPASCADAYTNAQTLRNDRKLLDARAALRICVQPTCKDFIVKGCTDWLAQVEASMPSVVPVATDAAGNDLPGVKVLMDGKVLLEKIDGRSVDVDPGTHTFSFEAPDGTKAEKEIVVAEGEKQKRVAVTLGPAATSTPAATPPAGTAPVPSEPSSGSPWKTVGLVTAGVGAAGLVAGSVFGVLALSGKSSCGSSSNPCTAGSSDANNNSSAVSNGNISTVLFVAGGVLAAGGVTLWLLAPSGSGLQAGPTAMNGGAGMSVQGVW